MFGKIMALDDPSMEAWFTLLTRVADAEVETLLAGHPREAKARLAREIVTFFHSSDAADVASKAFDRQFRDRQLPENIQTEAWPVDGDELPLAILLKELGLAKSSSEARRLVQQGGVRLDGDICQDPMQAVLRPASEFLLQVGKRRFQRVTPR
jgi:tyrosyl-tRNA synthetase